MSGNNFAEIKNGFLLLNQAKNKWIAVGQIRVTKDFGDSNNWHYQAKNPQQNQQWNTDANQNQQSKDNTIDVKVNMKVKRFLSILFHNWIVADKQNGNGYADRYYRRAKKYRSMRER